MPSDLPVINVLLGQAVVTALGLLGFLALRDARRSLSGRLLALLCFCLVGLGLAGLAAAGALPAWFRTLGMALGVPNVALFWWFCLSLLDDEFRLDPVAWAGFIVLSTVPFLYLLEHLGATIPAWRQVNVAGSVMPLLMIAHLTWRTIAGLAGDLIAPRRRARIGLVVALLVAASVSLLSEQIRDGALLRNLFSLLAAALVFFWLAHLRPDRLSFEPSAPSPAPKPAIDPRDLSLHRRLLAAMDDEALYLEHRLSIADLAAHLGTAEHRLRSLINGGLGHRNFAAFLNQYRLAHAKGLLADPERSRETVLAIALDSGFASLQTFNRVFKQSVGTTPSAFRQAALAELSTP